ncbi:hypothetical protein [Acinetobacter pittii]|uniref:hypothetical protein n=1 Tax=Acinetobacter pittii TaxID=48296 RepID=UPI0021CDA0BC|nr:hypothetical protein [Acinetobacter pittii]MCU4331945.1 hypothetical protein [Acinetobacter pittii]
MPLPNADQFVGQNVTESGFKQAQTQLIQFLDDEVPTNEKLVNTFATKAIADSKTTLMPIDYKVTVTSDPDETKNGDYTWNGTELVKSPYDPVVISNGYTNKQVEEIGNALDIKMANDPTIDCIYADALGRALIYYDKINECFVGAGLFESLFKYIGQMKKYEDDRYSTDPVDANGRLLFGWDKLTDRFFCGENFGGQQQTKVYKYYEQKPLTLEINHILSYGQSLSVGATATTLLSTSQPYFNKTFSKGPRLDPLGAGETLSVIPLVEQFNSPSSDGYSNRGETHCSGMANYASRAMMLENGIDPASHVIFASTAGHGGYTIDQLKKGSAWYSVFINHVNKAKELNAGKTYHVPVVPWIQGENNAYSLGEQTPYAVYKAALAQLQADVSSDIQAITSQVDPVRFITYQMSYAAATWPDVAKAQLDLVRESENFMLSTPMYHFPYAVADSTHLTNIGYKWLSAYIGRAYKQYMIEGRKPDFINPLAAQIIGNQITIKFEVPTLPLQIDTSTLASTTNAGFKVMNGSSEIPITSVTALDDTVILQLTSAPTSPVKVRYALDYLGTGLIIREGASGNLRDSTKDTAVIAGVTKPLYHVCPHFELTAFLDKGI